MEFRINDLERERLYGLPHLQQLIYYTALRPYMDFASGFVGVKRGISYQSIKEAVTVFPQRGFKVMNISRDQVRRAVHGLERAGLVQCMSQGKHLILKCLLATTDFSNQNKAATRPPCQDTMMDRVGLLGHSSDSRQMKNQVATADATKATIPPGSGNLIYMFEQFWKSYPQQCSKQRAQAAFMQIRPDMELFEVIMSKLDEQKQFITEKKSQGEWVPKWKYPANWLLERCWEENFIQLYGSVSREKQRKQQTKRSGAEVIWESCRWSLD